MKLKTKRGIGKFLLILLILCTTLPFLLLFTNLDFSIINSAPDRLLLKFVAILANVLGFIGAAFMFWNAFLGIRFLVSKFSDDYLWVNKIHQLLGKYGIIFVLAHPLFQMFSYLKQIIWIYVPDISSNLELYITFGRIAFYAYIIIWITSAILKEKIGHRPWMYFHYLTYPTAALVFIHALDIGTYLDKYLYLRTAWVFLGILFAVMFLWRISLFAGIGKRKGKVSGYQLLGTSTIMLCVDFDKPFSVKRGQYVHLQLGRFGEEHPFTVAHSLDEGKRLLFYIKIAGPFTKKLLNLLQTGELTLFVDGPYGIYTREDDADVPIACFAGGVGIAPFLELPQEVDNYYVYASYRFEEEIIEDEYLTKELGKRYKVFLSRDKSSKKHISNSRILQSDVSALIWDLGKDAKKARFYVCGSETYIAAIVELLLIESIPARNIYIEEFS